MCAVCLYVYMQIFPIVKESQKNIHFSFFLKRIFGVNFSRHGGGRGETGNGRGRLATDDNRRCRDLFGPNAAIHPKLARHWWLQPAWIIPPVYHLFIFIFFQLSTGTNKRPAKAAGGSTLPLTEEEEKIKDRISFFVTNRFSRSGRPDTHTTQFELLSGHLIEKIDWSVRFQARARALAVSLFRNPWKRFQVGWCIHM